MAAQLLGDRLTFRVDTPAHTSPPRLPPAPARAADSVRTIRWRSGPERSCGTRSSSLPTRVIRRAAIVARTVAEGPAACARLRSSQRLVHLRFQHRLHHRADHLAQPIGVRKQNVLTAALAVLPSVLSWWRSFQESGDVNITSRLLSELQNLSTLPLCCSAALSGAASAAAAAKSSPLRWAGEEFERFSPVGILRGCRRHAFGGK